MGGGDEWLCCACVTGGNAWCEGFVHCIAAGKVFCWAACCELSVRLEFGVVVGGCGFYVV